MGLLRGVPDALPPASLPGELLGERLVVSRIVGHALRLELGGPLLDAGFALLECSPVFLKQQIAGNSVFIEGVQQLRGGEGGGRSQLLSELL